MNINDWKVRYKDNSPQETVERIIGILSDIGLETEYNQFNNDTKACFSARVHLKNKGLNWVGANGKGTSEEFCRASAYAELIERIQNRIFFTAPRFDSEVHDILKKAYPLYTARGEYQPDCIKELKAKLATTAKPMPLFGKTAEDVVDDLMDKIAFGREPGFTTVPFYAVKARETVYLPEWILNYFCASNGMAAGNSLEEAIVQAISEIFERYVQLQMVENKIVPPQIPREEVARYPIVDAIINEIESKEQYRVYVMDCSLGKGLPVVCGAVVDIEQQTLGLKFGSHPDLGVALERIFSEGMQGKHLDTFVKMNAPNFSAPTNDPCAQYTDNFNMLKIGIGDIPAWLLYDEPSYEFTRWQNVEGMSNYELMHSMLKQLGGMCSDVYIRDVSYLGFPTVMVYAPGVSEVTAIDVVKLKICIMQGKCQKIFSHLDTATDDEVQQLIRFATVQGNALFENSINILGGMSFTDKMPFANQNEAAFLMAVCHYRLGNLSAAANALRSLAKLKGYDYAAALYIKARAQGASHTEVAQVLKKLCKSDIAQKVLSDFEDPATVLSKIYPVCPNVQCDKCKIPCENKTIEAFYTKLIKLELENSSGTANLAKLFNK